MKPSTSDKTSLMQNRRARHDYTIEDTLEAGIVLQGTEVKSIKGGLAQLTDAYIEARNGEAFLNHMKISAYPQADRFAIHSPDRPRKLLLHRREILKLEQASNREGYTLIPLEVYMINGKIKVLLGIGKGKKQYDKRVELRRKDAQREMDKTKKLNRTITKR